MVRNNILCLAVRFSRTEKSGGGCLEIIYSPERNCLDFYFIILKSER